MASQTEKALAQRAIGAANRMEELIQYIKQEMGRQNVSPFDDEGATVTLSADRVRAEFSHLEPLIRKIRELDGNRTKERVRGRGYPSN